jgi:hypothetical protein
VLELQWPVKAVVDEGTLHHANTSNVISDPARSVDWCPSLPYCLSCVDWDFAMNTSPGQVAIKNASKFYLFIYLFFPPYLFSIASGCSFLYLFFSPLFILNRNRSVNLTVKAVTVQEIGMINTFNHIHDFVVSNVKCPYDKYNKFTTGNITR